MYIGTDNGDQPGPEWPFGMIQVGPDGDSTAFNFNYTYSKQYINEFAMTHLNGAGTCGKGHLQFMATTGNLSLSPGPYWSSYGSAFSRSTETVVPGYYAATLSKYDIKVELTSTSRTAFGRFTFPSGSQGNLLFNVTRCNSKDDDLNSHRETSGSISITGNNQITGMTVGAAAGINQVRFPIYFAIQFDQPFTACGTWKGNNISAGNRSDSGALAGGYVTFDASATPVVQMKYSISYVSLANAQATLAAEIPNWDFTACRASADSVWNSILGKIQITGGSTADINKFYAGLYHCFLHPNAASDLNGEYMGFDNAKHTADDFTMYQTFSGWDIFRSWIQIVSILAPREVLDIVKSLIASAQQGKGFPQWSDQNKEMKIMVGDPSVTMICDACAFGVRGFDYTTALELMDQSATVQSKSVRDNVSQYNTLHYLPDNAAKTQDYAGVDFAISVFAAALGDNEKFKTYSARGQWWKNNFNTSSGYLQARTSTGAWLTPWSPTTTKGYVEDNATVYTWLVPYNLEALFDLMGGISAAIPRLDDFFSDLSTSWSDKPYINITNEPSFSQPYIYNSVLQPWKSQKVVRDLLLQRFSSRARGYPGDDDLGGMSSWVVWASLGMYPAYPGMDIMVLVGPLFPAITINTGLGKTIHITATGAAPDAPYIQSLKVNETATTKTWIHWSEIADNGSLEFVMGTEPNTNWGINQSDAPPSFDSNDVVPTPVASQESFSSGTLPECKGIFRTKSPNTIFVNYWLPKGTIERLSLEIFDLSGKRKATIIMDKKFKPGINRISIDNFIGPHGIYIARLHCRFNGENRDRMVTSKMLIH